jgi:hypothetical protein
MYSPELSRWRRSAEIFLPIAGPLTAFLLMTVIAW